jgi:D-3-phosphoglycerate dehydrogenase / 2-oxoglutarate reductase
MSTAIKFTPCRRASRGISRRYFASSIGTSTSDIEVEHGRGEWRTYGNLQHYKPGKHQILTFNQISPIGLSRFPSESYDIIAAGKPSAKGTPHAILLRSHKLQEDEVPHTVRAIARCGAGTNNVPVQRMTELGT